MVLPRVYKEKRACNSLRAKTKWAVEFTGKVQSINRLLQVSDSISCLWLWFLLARWIDSQLHALSPLGLHVYGPNVTYL